MELVLTGIRKDFGEKKGLRDVACTFEKGKIYGLLGRNGAGKTTLFNCLAGELDPDGELSGIEYVKTKRNTEWFFHTGCLNSVWKCKIQWEA